MMLFSSRKPRPFRHTYIYADNRQQKLQNLYNQHDTQQLQNKNSNPPGGTTSNTSPSAPRFHNRPKLKHNLLTQRSVVTTKVLWFIAMLAAICALYFFLN